MWAWDGIGQSNTPLQTFAMQVSLGYFLYDLVVCLLMGDESLAMMAHHLASLSGLLFGVLTGR